MNATLLEPILIVIAFAAGLLIAIVGVWQLALLPSRRTAFAAEAALRERDAALNEERIRVASAQAESQGARLQIDDLKAAKTEATLSAETQRSKVVELEKDLSSATARIEQMKLSEQDVEARLQRVAGGFVKDAQEVLLKAATERFQGDASAFRERLVASVNPLNDRIDLLGKSLAELGTARTTDQERVSTLLEGLNSKMAGIDDATRRVERVLGNSQARGSWGEFELKRLLELTGMTEHISFETQESGFGSDAAGRPDVVLRIPGNQLVPIDSKVPFARYQEAVSAPTDAERELLMTQAVTAVRGHVRALAARKYHDTPGCIGWTIMFVPIEAMLSSVFALDHDIFEVARNARVLIASPLSLMLYLEAFSRSWAAQKQSENAAVILEEARVLVQRLSTFSEKFGKVGSTLNSALDKYNEAVASFEGRLAPQARKIAVLRGDGVELAELPEHSSRARTLDSSRLPTLALTTTIFVEGEVGSG